MEANDVLDVLAVLAEDAIAVTLDGGWGIDALLGAQHRDHDDLDLLVDLAQADVAVAALAGVGFAIVTDARPTRVAMADRHGHRVDLHLVRTDDDGDLWQSGGAPDGSDLRYWSGGLTHGSVSGQTVACIDAHLQSQHHAGYEPQLKDREDLQRLQQRFGVGLPEGYW